MNKYQKLVQQQFINDEEKVIKRLKSVYNQSLKDIESKAKKLQKDIEELDKLAKLPLSDEEKEIILSQKRSKVYQKKYQDSLKKQVDDILDTMHEKEFVTVADYLDICYENGFIGTMYDLQGQGIPLCFPLDQEAMVRAVQLDSKISKGLYTRLGEDVTTLKKKITAQVSRGISTGMSFQQVAQQLAGYTNIGFNNAVRIARTEGHRVQVQSGMDACYKAQEKGCDVVKQWDSTLDKRTRESHAHVDGEIRELDQPFSNGLMFPGDPDGGAAEVINCRCALLQRARWALDDSFTKMNNFSKQLETFDSPESYTDFKKAFFSKENRLYMDYVEQMESKYGTKNFEKVLGSMTDGEYKHYSKLLNRTPIYGKNANGIIDDIRKKISDLTNPVEFGKIPSKRFGFSKIKGKHSITDDIGTQSVPTCNPLNKTGGTLYQNNCGNCSATFEMRRRGCNVEANPSNGMRVADWLKLFNECKPIELTSKRTDALVDELQQKLSAMGNGARGSIFVLWKGKTRGHFFSWEVEGGKVHFVDGQNGKANVVAYFKYVNPTKTRCVRWDNLEPSDLIKNVCKNKGGD